MSEENEIVYVVDDEAGMRKALTRLLRAEGFDVQAFPSARDFFSAYRAEQTACLILDVAMPELDGIELQRRLARAGVALPIVFLTGKGDIPTSVHAIKAGAVDFLTKPVRGKALVAAVRAAIDKDASVRRARADTAELRQRLASLTPREREVLEALAAGSLTKQIAWDLGITEQTVKFHRARIMERMQARTTAELMHIAVRLGIGGATPPDAAGPSVISSRKAPRT